MNGINNMIVGWFWLLFSGFILIDKYFFNGQGSDVAIWGSLCIANIHFVGAAIKRDLEKKHD